MSVETSNQEAPSITEHLAKQKFLFATILLSEKCNASCPHCINSDQRNQKTHMDEKKLKMLVEDLLSPNFENLKLLGGEPTVHPNFLNLYEYFQDKFRIVTLFSNALNEKIKEISPRKTDYITYNGYFVNENFDTEKFLPDNREPFLRTIQNVINMNFDFDKFKKRALFVRNFFRRKNIEQHYVLALSLDCTENIFIHAKRLNEIFVEIIKFSAQNKIRITTHRNAPLCFFVDPELVRLRKIFNSRFFRSHICDVSYGQAIIDTDFNLKYCDRMPRVLGNVFKNDFETINFEEFKLMMYQGYIWKMQDNYSLRCKDCPYWARECNGGCYANIDSNVFSDNVRDGVKCNSGD